MPEMEEKCSNFSVAFNKDYVFKKKDPADQTDHI